MARVSVVCTVKNEKATIEPFLNSLLEQSRLPDEVVIVDGGSSDGTTELINIYSNRIPIKLIVSLNVSIAKGRNIAIRNASYELIAATDGGCRLDPNWLRYVVKPMEDDPDVDVVSGFYRPWITSNFEELASYLLFFPSESSTTAESFLPSGRSIAFRRTVWEKVGGYPEWLATAEDTLFDLSLKKAGAKIVLAKKAVVFWRIRSNIKGLFRQYYNYAKGDGFVLLFPSRYLVQYAVVACLALLLFMSYEKSYLLFPIGAFIFVAFSLRYFRRVKRLLSIRRFLTVLCIATAMELGAFFGFAAGLLMHLKATIRN